MSRIDELNDGSLRTLRRLAEGGMGQVEIAVRLAGPFKRLYAVKRLRKQLMGDEEARTMFLDEARLTGLVRHPNVVSVLDVGVDRRGPFLVMDFVEGLSAAQLITWAHRRKVQLPMQVCLRIAHQVAIGLHAAHELRDESGRRLGLVHRDVSPQNVLIGFDGVARLTDFGIAKALGRTTRTTTGLLKGKVGYMSPEQLRFEEPDHRSDLFSFGVVLYELVAARRLYRERDPAKTARRILNEPPPDLDDARDDVPDELVELLFLLLAKDPDVRPPNAKHVADTLDTIVSDLVAIEGRIDVEPFFHTHFADDALALRSELDELVTGAERQEAQRRRTSALRRSAAWVALGVVLAGGAATAWAITTTSEPPPTPAIAAPAPELELETREPSPSLVDMDVVETEPETKAAPARMRRRANMRRRNTVSMMTSDRLFEWGS